MHESDRTINRTNKSISVANEKMFLQKILMYTNIILLYIIIWHEHFVRD